MSLENESYAKRLQAVIPGGAHTYSRGDDQYPLNAPSILKRGKGAYIYDDKGNELLDWGMALRSVNIGYSEETVNQGAIEQIGYGNNLTRPSLVELEAAELFTSLIPSGDMVKFTKNGSSSVSAAVKLARAYTGKELIVRCADHPFFSFDDWFIGSTNITRGVPENIQKQTLQFRYNDIASLQSLIEQSNDNIACVVLEPATLMHPAPSKSNPDQNFLHEVQDLCKKKGIVFILDEMITGFRWDISGAQKYYNLEPDLSTFGKAMANGFSVAALTGKKEIMELGSIDKEGQERVFLLSTTHGAEMSSLGAFVKTMNFLQENNVIEKNWQTGKSLIQGANKIAKSLGIEDYFFFHGIECSPTYTTLNRDKELSLELRTLFSQEMIKNGVLMPWVSICYRHGQKELQHTMQALESTLKVYKNALEDGDISKYLVGDAIKPVFRKFN